MIEPVEQTEVAATAPSSQAPLSVASTQIVANPFWAESATLRTTLFRTYAYRHHRSNKWKLVVQGRRSYDIPTRMNLTRRLMLRGLLKRLELGNDILLNPEFQSRVSGFLVCSEPGEKVKLRLSDFMFTLRRRIKKSGLFGGRTTLPDVSNLGIPVYGTAFQPGNEAKAKLVSEMPGCEASTQVLAADKFGLSIISDIDDTIKQTNVSNRKLMLERTFVRPFEAIGGMVELYQNWSKQYPALFHYVSSSPCQLYRHLESFMDTSGFPTGAIHLRWFTLREEFLKKWKLSRGRKKESAISTLIKRMPMRTYVLVGDSSEQDPDIYCKLAAKFPKSVAGIVIRNVEANPLSQQRVIELRESFGKVPLRLFEHPDEIQHLLEEWSIMKRLQPNTL